MGQELATAAHIRVVYVAHHVLVTCVTDASFPSNSHRYVYCSVLNLAGCVNLDVPERKHGPQGPL